MYRSELRDRMRIREAVRKLIETTGYTIRRLPTAETPYDQDGLTSVHNHDFMKDPDFIRAYNRGCLAAGDYHWHWRIHLGLWSAKCAAQLSGDFVECGVNRGFLSSAVMEYLDWNSRESTFYLLDTFEGIDLTQVAEGERQAAAERNEEHFRSGFYVRGVDSVVKNFSEWKHVKIIPGSVPGTLSQVDSDQIAWLHLDMNCAEPEVLALEYFWDRLVTGAVVLLDDYAYRGFTSQKRAIDRLANRLGIAVASLPTGQGLILRPPH